MSKNEENIAKIDKNFAVQTKLEQDDVVFFSAKEAPIDLYGLYKGELDVFKRMPESVANQVSNGVKSLNFNTAGGRIRFKTDSDYVAIKCVMPSVRHFAHMPLTGTSSFDIYEILDGAYYYQKTFVPPYDMTDGYESIYKLPNKKMREFEINFPLYNRVNELYVGIREGSIIDHGSQYRYSKPVFYYGSSVTQGGCASKPSGSFQSIISHRLDCDYINLGFSGNAKGEDVMADYIANTEMSVFVCDYDYNAPNSEHLNATHLKLYKKFREKQPDTPIIFVSAPLYKMKSPDLNKRRNVVYETYMYAVANNDLKVAYVDGYSIYGGNDRNVYTVDGAHPNDAGFLKMADVIGGEVRRMLTGAYLFD